MGQATAESKCNCNIGLAHQGSYCEGQVHPEHKAVEWACKSFDQESSVRALWAEMPDLMRDMLKWEISTILVRE